MRNDAEYSELLDGIGAEKVRAGELPETFKELSFNDKYLQLLHSSNYLSKKGTSSYSTNSPNMPPSTTKQTVSAGALIYAGIPLVNQPADPPSPASSPEAAPTPPPNSATPTNGDRTGSMPKSASFLAATKTRYLMRNGG